MRNWQRFPKKFLKTAITRLLKLYQITFSPDHGSFGVFFSFYRCRFYPSCSDYVLSSFRQHGLLKGIVVSLKRILRCNPFNKGGYDPVKRLMTND